MNQPTDPSTDINIHSEEAIPNTSEGDDNRWIIIIIIIIFNFIAYIHNCIRNWTRNINLLGPNKLLSKQDRIWDGLPRDQETYITATLKTSIWR